MSSNFLNTSGIMTGTDLHDFQVDVLEVAVPEPTLHWVLGSHDVGTPWRIASSVTTDGCEVLQNGWQMLFVPHVPIPPGPPHLLELVTLAIIVYTSSSQPQLAAHSVTAEGLSLLTAVIGPVGTNANCGYYSANVDLNFNSVQTTPSLGDYVAAAVGSLLSGIYNFVQEEYVEEEAGLILLSMQMLADLADRYDKPVVPWLLDPPTQVISLLTEHIQEWVDSIPLHGGGHK